MEIVESCEELLWQIGTQGRLEFEDKRKENQVALMRRLEWKRYRSAALRVGMRTTAVVAAVLVLVVVGDGILNREWLSGNSTDDGQQYAIQGQSIDLGLVEEGVAAGDDNIASSLTTTEWGAVVAFLGIEPTMPVYLPEGWRIGQYHAVRFDDELILNTSYINETDSTAVMIFLWDHYCSVEAANLVLEQNKDGEMMEIGGVRVYLSSNMEKNRFVWIDGTTVCSLTTTCDVKEAEAVLPQQQSGLKAESATLEEELTVVSDLMQKCIYENAHVALDQVEYQKRYDGLTARYDTAKARYDEVNAAISDKQARQAQIEAFLETLRAQDGLIEKFEVSLWCGLVDFVTVYAKDDVRFTFKDGTGIRA